MNFAEFQKQLQNERNEAVKPDHMSFVSEGTSNQGWFNCYVSLEVNLAKHTGTTEDAKKDLASELCSIIEHISYLCDHFGIDLQKSAEMYVANRFGFNLEDKQ